jgi:hypothetical protein
MGLEFDALLTNGIWSLCPRPLHQHIVRNRWVYKIKRQQDGSIECFKARIGAKGFDQKSGVDFHETFSPIIKQSTIRVVLTLAVNFDWYILQLDISNAFLHGYLAEDVFMEQPKGFVMLHSLTMSVIYIRLSMALNKHLMPGLTVFLKQCLKLVFSHLRWTHPFLSTILRMQPCMS